MANPNGTLPSGTLLKNGTYRVEKILGQGGFGITYLSTHVSLGKNVVIKEFFLQGYSVRNHDSTIAVQSLADNEYNSYKERFLDEARMLAKFEGNRNIVGVTDHFEEKNTAYFVMPLLKGYNLGQIIKAAPNERIQEKDALDILNQLSNALIDIHAQGVLHRDIKPENIIITDKGTAVLIDFGAAREFIRQEASKHSVLLTPGFAPIEQYDLHAQRGAYTDIYAVGATLYKALTGKNPPASPARSIEQMIEPKALNPLISEKMNAVILKAMALRPQERFQSIEAMLGALKGNPGAEIIVTKVAEDSTVFVPPVAPPEEKPPIRVESKQKKTPPVPNERQVEQDSKLRQRGDSLFRSGRFSEAAVFYKQMLGANPADVYARRQLAECELKLKPKTQPKRSFKWVKWLVFLLILGIGGAVALKEAPNWLKKLNKEDSNVINAPEMILVNGGFFQMGVPYYDNGADDDEKPKHSVNLNDFYIGKKEISVKQYRTFCTETGTLMPPVPTNGWVETNPIVNVSRKDALKYCEWLSQKTGGKYRLPTEAEWEYAARGGTKSKGKVYSGSDNMDDVAWHSRNAGGTTKSSGSKKANELAIWDMSGNVWEWVADMYDENFYKYSPKDNPMCVKAKEKPGSKNRNIGVIMPALGILRGGSFRSYQHDLRITDRLYFDETKGKSDFGFRVARNL